MDSPRSTPMPQYPGPPSSFAASPQLLSPVSGMSAIATLPLGPPQHRHSLGYVNNRSAAPSSLHDLRSPSRPLHQPHSPLPVPNGHNVGLAYHNSYPPQSHYPAVQGAGPSDHGYASAGTGSRPRQGYYQSSSVADAMIENASDDEGPLPYPLSQQRNLQAQLKRMLERESLFPEDGRRAPEGSTYRNDMYLDVPRPAFWGPRRLLNPPLALSEVPLVAKVFVSHDHWYVRSEDGWAYLCRDARDAESAKRAFRTLDIPTMRRLAGIST